MRSASWLACAFSVLMIRVGEADEALLQRDLQNLIRADFVMATQGAGETAFEFRVPLPRQQLVSDPTVDGALTEPVWEEATSLPLPYVRGTGEGTILDQATVLAFRSGDSVYLGLRFPSRRSPGPLLTLETPGVPGRHVGLFTDEGEVTLESHDSTASLLQAAAIHVGPDTTVEWRFALPDRDVSIQIPGTAQGSRPLNGMQVRLLPSDEAWHLTRWNMPDDREGYRLSLSARQGLEGRLRPSDTLAAHRRRLSAGSRWSVPAYWKGTARPTRFLRLPGSAGRSHG